MTSERREETESFLTWLKLKSLAGTSLILIRNDSLYNINAVSHFISNMPSTCPPIVVKIPLNLLPTRPSSSICSISCSSCHSSIAVPPKKPVWGRTSLLPPQPPPFYTPSLYHYTSSPVPERSHFGPPPLWSVSLFPPLSRSLSLSLHFSSCIHSRSPRGAGSNGWRFTLIAAWLQASPGQSNFGASVCWMWW